MSRKKLFTAVGFAGVAALTLAGCSGGGGNEGTADAPVTITYSNFISNNGNEKNLAAIVSAFEEENPTITVEVKTLPYDGYDTALQTDLAAGTQSDVFDIDGSGKYGILQDSGVLAELDGFDSALYSPGLLETYNTDGTQFALPTSFSDVVMYYNTDLFDAAGVEYPTADWTWEDETAAAKAITDQAAGVWGDHQPVTYNEFYKVLEQNGASFLSDDGSSVAFNSDAGIEAAEWLVDKSGTVMPTIEDGQGTADFDTNLFTSGKLGMLHTGTWMFNSFADTPANWDIVVEPGNTQSASAVFSNAIGVSAASENLEAAQLWAQFMSSSDAMVDTRLDTGWELPPISDDAKLGTYLDKGKPTNRQAVFDAADKIAPAPALGDSGAEIQDVMTGELVEAQAGRITVQKALDNAEEKINALLAG
ncbi:sugar ABC transporter substrate-binding protein [Cryobacterium sp. PAMC25264]|uniref:ABC transporter substrate-binding protein n=1 Tax=Cryobacterium sp. PAMC25264 TaxID=2861288 RepID=UPI001C62F003|nr:sugar ABC transporter substrate-binding protein [Cryobacterium sp. PAMC25264]QYF74436.1 sugar ABC transporter substrate-binding protein [Cryobacterium sp. PAMC25264]